MLKFTFNKIYFNFILNIALTEFSEEVYVSYYCLKPTFLLCLGLSRIFFFRVFGINLTYMDPCIVNVFSNITKKMRRYTMYLFLWNALHVSGGSSAHHQELKTVYTASVTCQALLLLVAVVEVLELFHDSDRLQ
jgi:hypothetical protein